MQNNDKKNILMGIHDTIKGFVEGSLSRQSAEEKYTSFLKKYFEIQNNNITPNKSLHIKGLLNSHNVNNFCKVTCLLKKTGATMNTSHYAGDKKILTSLKDLMEKSVKVPSENKFEKVLMQKSSDLEYNLYFCTVTESPALYYLATVTSSHYFRENNFLSLKQLLHDLLLTNSLYQLPLNIDFLQDNSNKLVKYFRDAELLRSKKAVIYIFPSIDSIFGHLGIHRVKEVADFIMQKINENEDVIIELLQLNFKTYIAITDTSDKQNEEAKKKIDFLIEGITLPYKKKSVVFTADLTIYSFLDEIYSFQNKILTGSFQ